MWCPNCGKEYKDGFTLCIKCGSKLVEYNPIVSPKDADAVIFGDAEEQPANLTDKEPKEDMLFDSEPELLITVIGEEEALRVMQLLEDNLIPSLKKVSENAEEMLELETDFEESTEEFTAVCDEPLDTEELFDIYVPAGALRNAMRVVTEDERANTDLSETEGSDDLTEDGNANFEEIDRPISTDDDSESKDSFFARFKNRKKAKK